MAQRTLIVFVLVGLPTTILVGLPARLGLMSWTPPSLLVYLSDCLLFALVPLAFLKSQTKPSQHHLLIWGLLVFELFLSFLTLSKAEVIKTVLIYGLAGFFVKPNLRKLLAGGCALAVVYVLVLSPFVAFARIAIGSHSAKSSDDVTFAVTAYSTNDTQDLSVILPGVQWWWTRFSYSNAQLFAMRSYDGGVRGETLDNAFLFLIPRILYPEKPQMSPGKDFTFLATGNAETDSFTSPGAFAEGYWNGGWFGAIAVGIVMGCLITFIHDLNVRLMSEGRLIYLPFVWFWLFLAARPDDWFSMAYIGGAAQSFFILAATRFIEKGFFSHGRAVIHP
jgi:hypothetical protein